MTCKTTKQQRAEQSTPVERYKNSKQAKRSSFKRGILVFLMLLLLPLLLLLPKYGLPGLK